GMFARMLAGKPQRPLARTVDRDLLGGDLRPRQREIRSEDRAQVLRDAGHRVEMLRAADVEPMPDLGDAHVELALRYPDRAERLRERRWRDVYKRRRGGRHTRV